MQIAALIVLVFMMLAPYISQKALRKNGGYKNITD